MDAPLDRRIERAVRRRLGLTQLRTNLSGSTAQLDSNDQFSPLPGSGCPPRSPGNRANDGETESRSAPERGLGQPFRIGPSTEPLEQARDFAGRHRLSVLSTVGWAARSSVPVVRVISPCEFRL
jgi:hypothetical protein